MSHVEYLAEGQYVERGIAARGQHFSIQSIPPKQNASKRYIYRVVSSSTAVLESENSYLELLIRTDDRVVVRAPWW